MKRLIFILCILVTSCNKDFNPSNGRQDYLHRIKDTVVYVVGVSFEDGVNWKKGVKNDEASIIVLKNGKPYLKVPVGDKYKVSHLPDKHRFINGALYTDYAINNMTTISKNGRHLFSYEGEETLYGFLVKEGDVYTLGESKAGNGIVFRKNGKVQFQEAEAQPCGEIGKALYEDMGSLCFVYRKKYNDNQQLSSWYVFKDGKSYRVIDEDDVEETYSMKLFNGNLCKLINVHKSKVSPMLRYNNKTYKINSGKYASNMVKCELYYYDNTIYVITKLKFRRSWESVIWNNANTKELEFKKMDLQNFFINDSGIHYIATSSGKIKLYNQSGLQATITGDCTLMNTDCVCYHNDDVYMAISKKNKLPVIWHNGKTEEIPIKGYLTSIVVEYPEL